MIGQRILLGAVAIVAFPLMFLGALGMALWLAADGDCSPIIITRCPS